MNLSRINPIHFTFGGMKFFDLEKAISNKALKKYIDEVKKKQSVEKDFK